MANIRTMDLNLLVALDALLRHRAVTAAGQDVGLSQPAMSNALMRLRRMFDDELLVRVGRTMHLTPRAESLIEPVAEVLASIEAVVSSESFDPTQATHEFTIATADYVAAVLLPALATRVAADAPMVRISVTNANPAQSTSAHGPELWIVPSVFASGSFTPLFEDRLVCAVWRKHPLLRKRDSITPEEFSSLPHAAFALGPGAGASDTVMLRDHGVSRSVHVTVPTFSALPFVVSGTPMIAVLQERLGRMLEKAADIKLLPVPFDLPPITVSMQWAPRVDKDAAHLWFRRVVSEVAASLPDPSVGDAVLA